MKLSTRQLLLVLLASLLVSGCQLTVGDFVWEDLNMNGIQDGGEPGKAGVTVTLQIFDLANPDEVLSSFTTTTDSDGAYQFVLDSSNAPEDFDYAVVFELPDGYVFSPADANESDSSFESSDDSDVVDASGSTRKFEGEIPGVINSPNTVTTIDAGMYRLVYHQIGDFVWEDLNGNGMQDNGEPGIGELSVTLHAVDGSSVDSVVTDADGAYLFENVPAGDYFMSFSAPEGVDITWTDKDQGSDDALDSDVDPDSGQTDTFSLAADRQDVDAGALFVIVNEDETGGGGEEEDEEQVALILGPDPEDFPLHISPLTGTEFCDPEAKNWRTIGISQSHFPPAQTRPPTGLSSAAWVTEWWIGDGDTRMYALYYGCYPETYEPEAGQTAGPPEVGENQYLISDFVWFDVNGNSIQDKDESGEPSEPGVPGVTVTLIRQNQDILSTVTDAGGHYYLLLNDPEIGRNYRVRFDLPETSTGSFSFVDMNLVNEAVDSDANPNTGLTGLFPLPEGQNSINYIDAGLRHSILIEGVRSGRIVFQQVNKYFGACSIVSGVDPTVGQSINICGTAGFSDPNNIGAAGVDITRLKAIAEETAGDEPRNYSGNMFSVAPPPGGQEAQKLDMFYNVNNITQWQFDAQSGNYIRYQNSPQNPDLQEMSTERLNGEPLGFENVIVMFVTHNQLNAAGTIFETEMDFTTGTAKIFRDGMVYDAQWSTVSGEYEQETGLLRPIRFQNLDGSPFHLKPGKLWIHMVHTATGFSQPEAGCWRARWFAPVFEGE